MLYLFGLKKVNGSGTFNAPWELTSESPDSASAIMIADVLQAKNDKRKQKTCESTGTVNSYAQNHQQTQREKQDQPVTET